MKLIKNISYSIAISLLFAAQSQAYNINYLNKIFEHKGEISHTVSCYFTADPVCTALPHKKMGQERWQKRDFLFPMTKINGECQTAIKDLSKANIPNKLYKVAFKEVQVPVKGMLVSIEYDSHALGFKYKTCVAIQEQPSLVFQFYNKDILREIGTKSQRMNTYASSKKPHVVIDSGHGADDHGKVGCFGIREKDINLAVAKKVADLLRQEGFIVSMTRSEDCFVPLDKRTTLANALKADLFVSIHANGAPSSASSGIETFCSQANLFKALEHVDHDTETKNAMYAIEKQRYESSLKLAQCIHHQTIAHVRTYQHDVKDRKVKNRVSQVLLGTEMPTALIEIGFLSNEDEARRLNDTIYQSKIAQGICAGIVSFVESSRA